MHKKAMELCIGIGGAQSNSPEFKRIRNQAGLNSGYENGFENFYQPGIIKVKHEPDDLISQSVISSSGHGGR
jgi:hypothetical protein